MATILESIALENYRGHKSPSTPIDNIGNLLMLVGKNDIGKSSVLEALDVFFNTDDIKDSDYCSTNNAADLSIKCTLEGNVYVLKSCKGSLNNYTKNGSHLANRTVFESDLTNLHYNLFRADNTIVSSFKNLSVDGLVNKVKNEKTYKVFCKNNFINNNNITDLVNNTLLIAESFRKLKDFFILSNMQSYFVALNDRKDFRGLNLNKNRLLDKLRSFHFSNPEIEREKDTLFSNLLIKDHIYNQGFASSTITIKVNPSSVHYNQFRTWFISPLLEDITETSINWDVVKAYATEKRQSFKPLEDIEYVITDFKSNPTPIEKRGSGVNRLCAFYKFAAEYKTSISAFGHKFILAVEEPEISLHPSQQRKFIQQLLDISKNDDIQVIATTHSPYIVNALDEKSVCVLKLMPQKDADGNILTDVNGNPITMVSTKEMDKRILNYPSMAEINYLAFDEPSITYHQELYGQIEVECMGESNGCKINQIINAIWRDRNNVLNDLITDFNRQPDRPFEVFYDNNLYSSPDGNIPNRDVLVVPYCVRNSIDHPGNMNKQWKNNISVVDLSIKMLIKIYKAVEKAENSFLPTINSKTSDLDDYGHETFKCSGASDNNEHSLTYWVKYQIDHPNECLIRQNRRGQDNPNGEIKNKINFVKAMYDIDPDWLTK